MAYTLHIVVALVALSNAAVALGFGPLGGYGLDAMGAALPAAAAGIESAKATGHAMAAENRATEAMIDRATGNPIGAAINENRALGHSVASNMAATRSSVDAGLAGGLGGSGTAALGANIAANAATRASGLVGGGPLSSLGAGPIGLPYGYPGAGLPYGGPYPGAYGAGYGYPYGYPGFVGPLGYGAGMNRALVGQSVATGAALANGMAGAALSGSTAGIGIGSGLGVSY